MHLGAPLAVAGRHERLAVASRAAVVHLQAQVTPVGQPLRLGIPAPGVARLRPAVHVEHRRQAGPAAPQRARREGGVPVDGQPVPGLERERLHPGQVEAGQLRPGGEQEAAGAAAPVVGEVLNRAGVVGEGDQPRRVGFVAADRLRVAGVQRPDRLEVRFHRRVEHVVLGAVLEHLDDLRLPGIRVEHRARHVRLGVLEQHLGLAGGQVDPAQPAGVRAERADGQQRRAVPAEREHVAGRHVVGRDGEQRPPVGVRAVADE